MNTANQTNRKVNTTLQRAIESILTDRPVAYHAVLAKAVGSANAGLFLSQLLYWTPRAHDQNGWIYKTQQDIYDETALTRREQETARRLLRSTKVLKEKKAGVPSRLFFRVDMEYIAQLLGGDYGGENTDFQAPEDPTPDSNSHDGGNVHRTMAESAILVCTKAPDKDGGNRQTINETETTIQRLPPEVVVVCEQLKNFGLSEKVSNAFVAKYPAAYLTGKLAQAEALVDVGNPSGWLRKAIEEDYRPAESTTTRREKKVAAAAEVDKQLADKVRERYREQSAPEPIGDAGLTTESAWNQTLDQLKEKLPGSAYQRLEATALLSVADNSAVVMVPNESAAEYFERRHYQGISRALGTVIGQEVEVQFISA